MLVGDNEVIEEVDEKMVLRMLYDGVIYFYVRDIYRVSYYCFLFYYLRWGCNGILVFELFRVCVMNYCICIFFLKDVYIYSLGRDGF